MNLTNLADIRALLARHDFRFSKSLGQNFLTAAWVPADIADASGADARTGVLEVGPGIGCLTEQLAQRAGKVVSVELDRAPAPPCWPRRLRGMKTWSSSLATCSRSTCRSW